MNWLRGFFEAGVKNKFDLASKTGRMEDLADAMGSQFYHNTFVSRVLSGVEELENSRNHERREAIRKNANTLERIRNSETDINTSVLTDLDELMR